MNFTQKFLANVSQNDLIQKNDGILVAFSGGKDSVCLLSLLHKLKEELSIKVGACHIHHGIRKEAEEDLIFCENFCKERKIPFYFKKVDVPAFCEKEGLGLEEGARYLRYKALHEILEKEGYHKIATAHTASDQGETILFHLIRGSGLSGTCGIPEKRDAVIRPLLPFFSEEIYDFLEENQLSFKKDQTNDDIIFSRNRIRHKILPEMEEISKGAVKSFARFSTISKWQTELNHALCDKWEESCGVNYENNVIPLSALQKLAKKEAGYPILHTALSRLLKNEKIVISFERFQSILPLLNTPCEGKIIEIPSAYCLRIENGFLLLEKNEKKTESIEYQVNLSLGKTHLPSIGAYVTRSDKRMGIVENINKMHLIITLSSDKIDGNLFARNRRDGDSIVIDGMTRSIKKLFQEAKIPAGNRDQIPLICDEKGIVWIPFIGLCDRVRYTDTGEVFTLSLEYENPAEVN